MAVVVDTLLAFARHALYMEGGTPVAVPPNTAHIILPPPHLLSRLAGGLVTPLELNSS
jgi:hypothetical protein